MNNRLGLGTLLASVCCLVAMLLATTPHAFAQTVPRTPVTVRVIDGTNEDPFNLRRIRHANDGHVVPDASGIRDAVGKIKALVKKTECIEKLIFHGHGRPGVLSIGKGSTRASGLTGDQVIDGSSFDPPHNTKLLKDLAALLCKGAEATGGQIEITLRGCCVGAWEEGAKKLFDIAQLFAGHDPRVCVTAPTGYLKTDVMETESLDGGKDYHWVDLEVLGTEWPAAYSTDTSPPPASPRMWPSFFRVYFHGKEGDKFSDHFDGFSDTKLTDEQVKQVWPEPSGN